MSEQNGKLTLDEAIKITTQLLKERKEAVEKYDIALATLVDPKNMPVPIEPINCPLLWEMLQATNELYYTRCIL